jgi:hypothetical protein
VTKRRSTHRGSITAAVSETYQNPTAVVLNLLKARLGVEGVGVGGATPPRGCSKAQAKHSQLGLVMCANTQQLNGHEHTTHTSPPDANSEPSRLTTHLVTMAVSLP